MKYVFNIINNRPEGKALHSKIKNITNKDDKYTLAHTHTHNKCD